MRYRVIKIESADYLMIGIVDNELTKSGRVICHMNATLALDDIVPAAELERLANIMCEALNKQS